MYMDIAHKVARALIESGAIMFTIKDPVPIASGLVSPVYVDCRVLPQYPEQWKVIIAAFCELIEQERLHPEFLIGTEETSVLHSVLGFDSGVPALPLQAKSKGLRKRVAGKRALLIEEFITTGTKTMESIYSLQNEEAEVSDLLTILACGFPESVESLKRENIRLHQLTSFPVVLEEAVKAGKISVTEREEIEEWRGNPYFWLSTAV